MSELYFSKINKVEAWDIDPFYLVFKQGVPNGAEEFVDCFNMMKNLLKAVAQNPDDFIKHHEKAASWLEEVIDVLNDMNVDLETGSKPVEGDKK